MEEIDFKSDSFEDIVAKDSRYNARGVTCTEDIGEMMFNLTENHRVHKDENDTPESFANGYDFKETFLGPYQV